MDIKKIKVTKDGVTKEVYARQEKDYVKNGWEVIRPNVNPFNINYTNTYNKK